MPRIDLNYTTTEIGDTIVVECLLDIDFDAFATILSRKSSEGTIEKA
ncbi:hypothetical protein [Methanocella arvoryzae]|nr:hypothetical protein [Methanocella arvoryzae]